MLPHGFLFSACLGRCFKVPHLGLPFAALARLVQADIIAAGALETLQSLIGQVLALVDSAYQRAPILVLVLSALLILPAAALMSFAVHARTRRLSRAAAVRAAERRAQTGELLKETAEETRAVAPTWASQAWLTVEGRSSDTMPLTGQVIRIGRHEDNDIRLSDRSVHRHHAVIERTAEEAFVITDVSGKDGNGVRINGERTPSARLADGDVIELGRARLRFETTPV
jgi:FHA domain